MDWIHIIIIIHKCCYLGHTINPDNDDDILTSDEHDADAKHFLGVGVGRHVSEADRGEAAEREIERRDVLGLDRRPTGRSIDIRLVRLTGQLVQPADLGLLQHRSFDVADGVPDAGEPVSDEGE